MKVVHKNPSPIAKIASALSEISALLRNVFSSGPSIFNDCKMKSVPAIPAAKVSATLSPNSNNPPPDVTIFWDNILSKNTPAAQINAIIVY